MNIKLQLAACISIAVLSGCTSIAEHNENILEMYLQKSVKKEQLVKQLQTKCDWVKN